MPHFQSEKPPTLHTTHCTIHTAHYTLHLHMSMHMYLHLYISYYTLNSEHYTLHTTCLYCLFHIYHFTLQTFKICRCGTQDLHGIINLDITLSGIQKRITKLSIQLWKFSRHRSIFHLVSFYPHKHLPHFHKNSRRGHLKKGEHFWVTFWYRVGWVTFWLI